MVTKVKEYTKLVGLKIGIPEPKQTININSAIEITKLLREKYKIGTTGKEYNLLTKYNNAIIRAIFNDAEYPILIKFPYVRKEWVKAAVHFMKKGKVVEHNEGILINRI